MNQLKMSEVLRIMKDRVHFGKRYLYDKDRGCYCALGALIAYHFPDMPEHNPDQVGEKYREHRLWEFYPELEILGGFSDIRNRIVKINDAEETDSYAPVIAYLEEQGL